MNKFFTQYFCPLIKSITIILIINTILAKTSFGQQVQKATPAGMKFFVYTPPDYNSSGGPYPLLLSLHGQGSIGDNLNDLITGRDVIPAKLIAENNWPANYPFIVVTPQLKEGITFPDADKPGWPPQLVDDLIEFVKLNYTIDANRIYITGLSMGGTGTWDYAEAFPAKVAAMIPIAGRTDTTHACLVKNIPTWVFHGSNDGTVVPSYSIDMVSAIKDCKPAGIFIPHLTILNAQKHEGWSGVFDNSSAFNVYDWLLQFSKNDLANKAPYVNAGNDLKILKRDQPLELYGEYFDIDGTISKVEWSQVSGGALTKSGANTPYLKLSNLVVGTYEFELKVTDNKGAQKTDRVKVEIVGNISTETAVKDLVLINSSTDQDIVKLTDGYLINSKTLATNNLNIRADVLNNPLSVRFKINGNHNISTDNAPGPFFIINGGWVTEEGEYLICATPYVDKNASGTEGISECVRLIISSETNPPPVVTALGESTKNEIDIYPNPASGYFYIQSNIGAFSHASYRISSMAGSILKQEELSPASSPGGAIINISELPSGIYLFIYEMEGKKQVKKLMIK